MNMIVYMALSWLHMQGEQGAKGKKGQNGPDGFQVSDSHIKCLRWCCDCILNRDELGHEVPWVQKDKKWVQFIT